MPRSVRARTGDASGLGRRAVVIAGGSATEAEADARAAGYEPVGVLDAAGLLRLGRGYRKAVRDTGADVAVLHSRAWGRQAYPQVFQLAMAATPLSERVLLDEEHGLRAIPRPLAFWQAARVPTDVVAGAGRVALEAVHHRRASRSVSALVPDVPADPHGIWLLAIWRNAADSRVGGSISHMGGILGGFRELGYRIALLTDTDPPEQLRAAADILEEVPAGPSSHRVTREAERVTSNARFRVAGERLMRQVRPAVVYQRHEYLFSAGALLAQHFNVPLVLEWNNSMTVSAVRAWLAPGPLDRPFQRFLAPLGARMERDVVRTATLIAAVSRRSAEMAVDLGAPAERVAVVPNAVDVDNVPYPGDLPAGGPVRLGWIGSFGTWHGASMMIRALALLSPSVGAVMVGDGPERVPCQELADQLGVAERIEFTGELPRDSALQRLTECTILVSPHIPFNDGTPFFGSPTKIFEYMALGRPMVVSDLEQLGELVDDGSTGRLVPPEDPAALAAVINDVIALPDRGAAMGRRARQAAESEHRWVCRAEAIHRRLVNAMPLAGALR